MADSQNDLLAGMRAALEQDISSAEDKAAATVDKGTTDDKESLTSSDDKDTKSDVKEDTPAQAQARTQGWMPLKEWEEAGNDPDLWKPAGAFLADGEIREELRGLKRAVKKRDKVIDSMRQQWNSTYEAGYQRALKDTKEKRDKAAEEGNIAEVVRLSDEMAELREKATTEGRVEKEKDDTDDKSAEVPAEEQAAIRKWAGNNPWYTVDKQLGQYADIVASRYLEENEGASVVDALQHATQVVRAQFPSRFKGTLRSRPAVDSGTDKRGPSGPTEPKVLQPRQLMQMENGDTLYGIYKNYMAAGMFKTDKNPKGKWTYEEWAKSIGAVKEE